MNFDSYTYANLLSRALEHVDDKLDKREGSVIFDALAPACYELAEMYLALKRSYHDNYILTANDVFLDLRMSEHGIYRRQSTFAIRKGIFSSVDGEPMEVPIGSRFSAIRSTEPLIFKVTDIFYQDDVAIPGTYTLTCEAYGSVGNAWSGELLPIDYIHNLGTAFLSEGAVISARDRESDEDARERYIYEVNHPSFGGNVSQYREWIKSIGGVGKVQIYPIHNGGGTVLVSVVDNMLNPVSDEFANNLAQQLDPENAQGDKGSGLGLAPIGHCVTVSAPSLKIINISARIIPQSGYSLSQLKETITANCTEYIENLANDWDKADDMNKYALIVYIAQINAAIISIRGVANVTEITVNGSSDDCVLTQSADFQEIPHIGAVSVW